MVVQDVSGTGSPRLFESIVVNATDVVLVTEAEPIDAGAGGPRVIYVNPAFTRMTGYLSADIVGKTPRILQSPHTDRVELDRLRAALGAWEPVEVELLNVRKDGTEFWVQLNITPVTDENGWYTHWVAIQRDITARKSRETALQALLADSSDLALAVDPSGSIRSAGPAASKILGIVPTSLEGRDLVDLVHPEDTGAVRTVLGSTPGLGVAGPDRGGPSAVRAGPQELRLRHADGSWRWLLARQVDLGELRGESPDGDGQIVTCVDITEQKKAAAALMLADDRFRSAFADAPIAMAVTDPSGRPIQVNAALCELLGRSQTQLLAMSLDDLTHPEDVMPARTQRQALLRGGIARHRHETRFLHVDGTVVGVLHSSSVVPGADGTPMHLVDHVEDITERKAFEAQLSHQAMHDPLTALPNRALLGDRLDQAIQRLGRTAHPLAVLFLDIDRFKVVNDSMGHQVGDEMLVLLARRIESVLRERDTAARFGGDEFVVLCEDTTAMQAAHVATRIRDVLTAPFELAGQDIVITVSIGAAMGDPDSTADALLRDADAAMYAAKDRGRDRYEMFDPILGSRATARMELEQQLRRAIDHHELLLHYQPEVQLGDHRVVAAEALIRWEHPDRGLLLPAEFIALAEETGLIHPLGRWALAQALSELAGWRTEDPAAPVLWLNLSPHQLADREFATHVASEITRHAIAPGRLGFEVTENAIMANADESIATLHTLKDIGVHLAIDDFGTGYSSLSYLKRLPIDTVKIDQSFIHGLDRPDERRESFAIVGAVVGLAHALDLRVIPEGVETATQAQALHGLGCDIAQGYLLGRPAPDLP